MPMPEPLPKSMTLKPSRMKWLLVFLIGAAFTATGLWMIVEDGALMAWFVTLFFGLVAIVALIPLIGIGSHLKLDEAGFEQSLMGRRLKCSWQNVSAFHTYSIGVGNTFVAFDRAEDDGKRITGINRAIAGGSAQLGDTFGMKAADLAALMNAFRDRALEAKPRHDQPN